MASSAGKAETFFLLFFFKEEKMCLCISEEPERSFVIFNEIVLSVFSFRLSQQQRTFPSEEVRDFVFLSVKFPREAQAMLEMYFFIMLL